MVIKINLFFGLRNFSGRIFYKKGQQLAGFFLFILKYPQNLLLFAYYAGLFRERRKVYAISFLIASLMLCFTVLSLKHSKNSALTSHAKLNAQSIIASLMRVQ